MAVKNLVHHLWKCTVKHRDYSATLNSGQNGHGRVYMTETVLIVGKKLATAAATGINHGVFAANAFLRKNRRMYGSPTIKSVVYDGTIDE